MLPPFLSAPVLVFLLFDVARYLAWSTDMLLLSAAALPTLVVLTFLLSLNRIESNPAEGCWRELLPIMNDDDAEISMVRGETPGNVAEMLVAAPLGEELLKGAGAQWVARCGAVDDTKRTVDEATPRCAALGGLLHSST